MIIDLTTDAININLASSITTNQLQFYVSYNVLTSTTVTPAKNQGTTNNTTAVTLLPSPSSGQQHQMRQCSIVNTDTKPNSVIIQYVGASSTANILYVSLLPNQSIQYTPNNGWQVYSDAGLLMVLGMCEQQNSLRTCMYQKAIGLVTTLTLTSGTDYAVYLGEADRNYATIKMQYRVTSSPTAITWSELAIYKASPTIGSATTALTRCGFADVSAVVNTTGIKTTTVTVTGVTMNDDLYAVFGSVHTGTYALRAGLADDLGVGYFSTVTGSLRPSTNSTLTVNTDSATAVIWCAWQPSQW